MKGAAVATVIGQVGRIIKPAPGDYALCRSICGRMLMLGIDKCVDIIAGLF